MLPSIGGLGGGSWVFLRECSVAPPLMLAALAATLLNIHHAHTYTPASPIIQVRGEYTFGLLQSQTHNFPLSPLCAPYTPPFPYTSAPHKLAPKGKQIYI